MPNPFNLPPVICPVNEEQRVMLQERFAWLVETFGKDNIVGRNILVPDVNCFPINYDGSEQSVLETAWVVATQMKVDPETISVNLYTESGNVIGDGGRFGGTIFLETEGRTGGLYWGKNQDGYYDIGVESKHLKNPEGMVAVLAHEIAHIKLLGEERITENDEPLTDLTTVIFGLGIFNANMAFQFKKDQYSWGYSRQGYLSQMEWGYALGLLAVLRGEDNPEWARHLTKNIQSDIRQSIAFIRENDIVFGG